jgi:hypothetical protein
MSLIRQEMSKCKHMMHIELPMLVLGVFIIWQFPENFSLRLHLSLVRGLYTEPQVYLHCAYTRATLLGL